MKALTLAHPKFYKKNNCYFAVDKKNDLIVEVDLDTTKIEPSDYFEFEFGTKIKACEFWEAYDKALNNLKTILNNNKK